jgi:uncharacterized integral membrane protein
MRTFKYIVQFLILLTLIIGGIFFGSENTDAIRIVLMGNLTDPIPIWFVVLIAFFMGAALSGVYFSFELFRLWMKVRRIDKDRGPGSTKHSGGFRFSSPSSTNDSGEKPRFTPFGTSSTAPAPRPFGPPPSPGGSGNDNR